MIITQKITDKDFTKALAKLTEDHSVICWPAVTDTDDPTFQGADEIEFVAVDNKLLDENSFIALGDNGDRFKVIIEKITT